MPPRHIAALAGLIALVLLAVRLWPGRRPAQAEQPQEAGEEEGEGEGEGEGRTPPDKTDA
ncbi:hypothetical protein [Streptomyces sp. NPDC057877]|uniref:hypothetical protein n=1 Tax=Streptomyces sp. NPDC057877 TaxID=3346269 RepID=UPI0036CD64A3